MGDSSYLVCGGKDESGFQSMCYKFKSVGIGETSVAMDPFPNMPVANANHQAAMVGDKVWQVGGRKGQLQKSISIWYVTLESRLDLKCSLCYYAWGKRSSTRLR